jgi:transposase
MEVMMARAYGVDLRRRVVDAIEGGLSTRSAARRFCIGESTAGAWHRFWRKTGSYEAQRQGNRGGSVLDAHDGFLMELIEAQADITLAEMAEHLFKVHALRVDPSTIWYFLHRRGLTYKKRQPMRANRTGPTS